MSTWRFTRDARRFLDDAAEVLAAQPLAGSVIATNARAEADRAAATPGEPVPEHVRWFATAHDGQGRPVAAAMRTHPTPPHPPYVVGEEADGVSLVAQLAERGEHLDAVNGFVPMVGAAAREAARRGGGTARETVSVRCFEVTAVVAPPVPPGRLRIATAADESLVAAWTSRFEAEADAQAGRAPGPTAEATVALRVATVATGAAWLWERPDGTPTCLVISPAAQHGVARVTLVMTPREHRGRGHAAAAVAEVAATRLAAGERVCLYADRANPVATGVYARIGFEPAHDVADWVIDPPV